MMTFYAAAGSYQIRSEDGKNMPYIMRLGKLQPVSIPEFSLWSMLLWDVLTYEELHKKFYDKMEETEIEPSSFDKSLEMLVKRKLIIKGVGYTGADALYNMLSDTYVIPLRGVQGTRKLMNVAKLLKQKKVNFFEAVYLLQPEKSSVAERRIMKLVLQTPLSVTPTPSPEPEKQEPVTGSEASQADYILNTNTKKFHYPTCSSVNDMKEKNKQEFFGTRDETIALGYSPCGRCKP